MGNADLRDLAVIEETTIDQLVGAAVAVDAPNWLYKYLTTTAQWNEDGVYTRSDGLEVPNLIGGLRGLPRFFEHDITPVFVFDGGYHERKTGEVEERQSKKEDAAERAQEAREDGDNIRAARLEARTQRLTDTVIKTTKTLFDHLDIPYMDAPQAAEAQAAYMNSEADVDYVISEDYDTLLFGAPQTIRSFTSSGDDIENMLFEDTLGELDVTQMQLVDMAILCGTDYNEGIHGVGTVTARDGVKKHGSIEGVLEENDADVPELDTIRDIFLNPAATDDYTIPSTYPDPDIEAAQSFVVDEWEIPANEVNRAFERIEDTTSQSGLGQWT